MHSGHSLWGFGVTRQVWEHFMIIGKTKPGHQSVVLLSFSIQGPKLWYDKFERSRSEGLYQKTQSL